MGALVTCDPEIGSGPLGLVHQAAVLCVGERIEYVGPESGVPRLSGEEPLTLDLDGCVVTPGLIDCHTHLVHAGERLDDYQGRLEGESYVDIAARGGGILSTVRATRAASDEELLALVTARAEAAAAHGVTTIEVKSGYGLACKEELRLLEVVKRAGRTALPDLIPTFLGAHTFPAEARSGPVARRRYVEEITREMLPAVAARGLARFCDVFIDEGAFTLEEGRLVLERARELGLGIKVHAEQITCTGAAELAGELGAVSAEYLEHISEAGLRALAEAGTVAVLLPGAALVLRDQPAQCAIFRAHGIPMAVATDFNPGTSPTDNLMLMAQLQVLGGGMTLDEGILAVTAHAARAVGLEGDRGVLRRGMRADLALFRCQDPRELLYRLGASLCAGVVRDGVYHRIEAARPGLLLRGS
ncbi:MAG: imidazolonepropionase [Deltaproteobacteria bacterium]|nr:imidazolonepropionase [Deltaproteobacteria bacterium]